MPKLDSQVTPSKLEFVDLPVTVNWSLPSPVGLFVALHRPSAVFDSSVTLMPYMSNHFARIKFHPRVRERTNKTNVTSRREKVPWKGLENVKLLAPLVILNPRPQEGLNKIFSSKFKEPKSTSQHIAKIRRMNNKHQWRITVFEVCDCTNSTTVNRHLLSCKMSLKNCRMLASTFNNVPLFIDVEVEQ
ncbi:hypothetical protein M9H77_23528 [Catharanthus roseus]|uniref:Uncharacterized protein n=1 Tax=Catharanthus roseus TaxID=4058 RepID=A0ACC0AVA3_CATRO|nr:hypothetical protein M9H77_23528 [Catharanthus roseus]